MGYFEPIKFDSGDGATVNIYFVYLANIEEKLNKLQLMI